MYNRSVTISGGQSGKGSEVARDDETHHGCDTKLMDDGKHKILREAVKNVLAEFVR